LSSFHWPSEYTLRYELYTDRALDQWIGQEWPQFYNDWASLENNASRADLARYLLVYKIGGVYCDVDTRPLRPIDPLLMPLGEEGYGVAPTLVIGLEANFSTDYEAAIWVYARRMSASLHVFAAAPHHPVLRSLVTRVIANVRQPSRIDAEIRARRSEWQHLPNRGFVGSDTHLRTVLTTGPGPFSDFTIGLEATPAATTRILGVFAFCSGSRPAFYEVRLVFCSDLDDSNLC
jgi:hypothetical protein